MSDQRADRVTWELDTPDYDLPLFSGTGTDYLICATPRSGSTLFAYLLGSCGAMGVPHEYLNADASMVVMTRRFGLLNPDGNVDADAYLTRLRQTRTSANGVFGIKVQFHQLAPFLRLKSWVHFVEGARLIRIRRRDLLAQAISLYIAWATNHWHEGKNATSAPEPPLEYDAAEIRNCLKRLAEGEAAFQTLFAMKGLSALEVWYEDLVRDPDAVCREVCRYVGVETDHVFKLDDAATRQLSTARNDEWKARFRSEHRASADDWS